MVTICLNISIQIFGIRININVLLFQKQTVIKNDFLLFFTNELWLKEL